MLLRSAARTDVGLKRAQNEDNFLLVPEHGLYILADGMGGHNSGQLASHLAVTLIAEFFSDYLSHSVPPDLPYDAAPGLPYEANLLANAIKHANERIFIESCKDRAAEGMGTTITALLDTPSRLILAHVGDSRIYRQRQGRLKLLTVDHSLANHLLSTGQLQPHEVAAFPQKNVIMRAIGLKEYVDVDVQVADKHPGDVFMMCSDGLCDLVEDPHIEATFNHLPSIDAACDQLIRMALNAGGKDNVTVVCVRVDDIQSGASAPSMTHHAAPPAPAYAAAYPSAASSQAAPPPPPPPSSASAWNRPLSNASVRRPPPAPSLAPPPFISGRSAPSRLIHAVRQPKMTLAEAIQRLLSPLAAAVSAPFAPAAPLAEPVSTALAPPTRRPLTPPRGVAAPSGGLHPMPGSSALGSGRRARRTLQDIPTFDDMSPDGEAPYADPYVSPPPASAPAAGGSALSSSSTFRKPPPARAVPDDDPVSEWDLAAIRAGFDDDDEEPR